MPSNIQPTILPTPFMVKKPDGQNVVQVDNDGTQVTVSCVDFLATADSAFVFTTQSFQIEADGLFYVFGGGGMMIQGNQVLTSQQPAIANATGAGDVVARLNDLLSALRTHGLIAT